MVFKKVITFRKMSSTTAKTPKPETDVQKRFNTLKRFVHEMSSFFEEDLSLKLYNHLLKKTTVKNRAPVSRHVELFEKFCAANRKQIVESNTALTQSRIEYSSRVYIDFSKIFSDIMEDENASETQAILFDHLLVLSMVFDPNGNAAEVLKSRKSDSTPEELRELFNDNPFLSDMMKKVESQVKPGANPMEAMTSMMSSGLLQELVTGMQENIENGDLDMDKLMSSVQKMTSSLPPEQLNALKPMLAMAESSTPTIPCENICKLKSELETIKEESESEKEEKEKKE
jgi:hypothetical protein